jgi:hypothetical protein
MSASANDCFQRITTERGSVASIDSMRDCGGKLAWANSGVWYTRNAKA